MKSTSASAASEKHVVGIIDKRPRYVGDRVDSVVVLALLLFLGCRFASSEGSAGRSDLATRLTDGMVWREVVLPAVEIDASPALEDKLLLIYLGD